MRDATGKGNIYYNDLFANGIPWFSLIFWCLNVSIGCFNLLLTPVFFYTACLKQSYHRNLRLVTSNLYLAFLISSVGNIAYSLLVLTHTNDKIYDTYFVISRFMLAQGPGLFKTVFVSMILERTAATILYKNYENRAPIILVVFVYCFGLLGSSFPALYFLVRVNHTTSIGINCGFGFTLLMFSPTLYWINKKMRLRKFDATLHLSHRYQINENLRFFKIMSPIIIFEAVYDISTVILYAVQQLIDFNTQLYYPAFVIMGNLFASIFFLFYLKRDEQARRKLSKYFCIKPSFVEPHQSQIKNVMGEAIVVNESPEIHFTQLAKYWT